MGKTFEDYAAEYAKDPYPFPLPGGASVLIPAPDLATERKAVAAANAADNLVDGLLDGLRVYTGADGGAQIAEAWGKLSSVALQAAINDMREYFGSKNS